MQNLFILRNKVIKIFIGELTMEEIKDLKSLEETVDKENWSSYGAASPTYGALTFECGCGNEHVLEETTHVTCAFPVKFLFQCSNGITTLVRVKGIFKQKSYSEWFCKSSLFDKFNKMKPIN